MSICFVSCICGVFLIYFQIGYGGEVPEKYFLQNADFMEQMQLATVPRGDKLSIDVQVDQPGSILK